ncbi:MAG: tryptophan synthase subunit alpha [Chloroflexota bacterium]
MAVTNGLDHAFAEARRDGRAMLIPYLTAGYPEPRGWVDLAVAILDAGADALEIGIPFSDPLLDGPAIQRSQQSALDAGVTPKHCLEFAAEVTARAGKPILFMGAYNPVVAYGVQRFCEEAATAKVSALIVPDLPFEEQGELRKNAQARTMHVIQMVAPTSTPERIARVCSTASGFIYCISVAGVTGTRDGVAAAVRPLVDRIRANTNVPISVGFGISTPDGAREVGQFADGVIVGSALINVLAAADRPNRIGDATIFIESLRRALESRSAE